MSRLSVPSKSPPPHGYLLTLLMTRTVHHHLGPMFCLVPLLLFTGAKKLHGSVPYCDDLPLFVLNLESDNKAIYRQASTSHPLDWREFLLSFTMDGCALSPDLEQANKQDPEPLCTASLVLLPVQSGPRKGLSQSSVTVLETENSRIFAVPVSHSDPLKHGQCLVRFLTVDGPTGWGEDCPQPSTLIHCRCCAQLHSAHASVCSALRSASAPVWKP
ncbi:hypothetical protein V8F06_006852 [Rhypophila decipiens]